MKQALLILLMLASLTAFPQINLNFLDKHIMGKGRSEPLQISVDAYPFLFLSQGGGGSVGVEFNNWQIGAIGFTVVPPDFIKNTFFRNAENISIRRNNAMELFANYFLRKDRKGIYGGLLGGPEWFIMEDNVTAIRETIVKTYIVPRIGIRVFPIKKFLYADASFGWSFNLSGTETKMLGASAYNASAGGFIYFLQIGARINLVKE